MKAFAILLAICTLTTTISVKPATPIEHHIARAHEAEKNNQPDVAITILQEILTQEPDNNHANKIYFDLGMLLYKQHKFQEAILYLKKAVQTQSDISTLFSLATTLGNVGEFESALAIFAHILQQRPDLLEARYNYAYMLKAAGYLDEAIDTYRTILAHNPDHAQAHLGLAFSYIMQGDFENGWQAHAWNLENQKKDSPTLRTLIETKSVTQKIIVLLFEGGLGDTLQFIRYAQTLKKAGATVIVRAQNPLHPLLAQCPYIDQLLHPIDPIPPHHARATLMALPAILNCDAPSLVTTIPYIFPDPTLISYWKEKLQHSHPTKTEPNSSYPLHQTATKNINIGICWQADVFNDSSRAPTAHRGIPLKLLATLSTIPGVTLYSLQKKDGLDQLDSLPNNIALHTFDELDENNGPFMDTAAIMENMHLIISVDSAIAHLAGALGRPVWLLLPCVTDWRWLHGKTDSPWYPTMRIFKQPKAFDWESVAQEVHEQVCQLVNTR